MPGFDEQWFRIEVSLAHLGESGVERRYDGRDNDAMNPFGFEIVHGEQITEKHAVFVHSLRCDSRDPPVRHQQFVARRFGFVRVIPARSHFFRRGKDTQHRVGIADIQNQKHISEELFQSYCAAQHRTHALSSSHFQKAPLVKAVRYTLQAGIFFDLDLPSFSRQ